jgi:orotidine-5'-phosphate decarboxylase
MACELILALDVPTKEAARPILTQLQGKVSWIKIGLQMFTAYGPDYVKQVSDLGYNIFLDLKLHDIPNTVEKAVESLNPLPIGMLTLHTSGGKAMMQAAHKAARQDLLLLGVTVLTSMDSAALSEIGAGSDITSQVKRLGLLASSAGLKGLVCSPHEVTLLRSTLPSDIKLVTPGIRPSGESGGDDQKRVMTPRLAAEAGSSYIVVGRPILQAKDPASAALAIRQELS